MRRRIMAFLWISSVFSLKLQNARYILLLEMYRLCHLTVSRDMGTLFSDTAHFIRERIMHMRRRLLAWVLVLAMGLPGVPIPALAEETPETPETVLTEETTLTEPAEEPLPAQEETSEPEEEETSETTEEPLFEEGTEEPLLEELLLPEEEETNPSEEAEASSASEEYCLPMEIPDDFVAPFASTYDFSQYSIDGEAEIPSYYDSRERCVITSVKSQGSYGLCWAFSALAVSESGLISAGDADESVDLSEWHLAHYNHGDAYDPLGNAEGDSTALQNYLKNGSNNVFTTFALANWAGAALESKYAYNSSMSGLSDSAAMDDAYHLANAYWINAKDTVNIKSYIMKNGAVGLSYYDDKNNGDQNFNYTTNAYYNSSKTTTNHAITVVGWDDDFSASNFNTSPSADGAWLCKNSWGPYWGDNGYFWLSYEDASINASTSKAFVFEMEPSEKYDWNYQYDGSTGTNYISGSSGLSVASVFRAAGSTGGMEEEIRAVGMGVASADVDYSIQIYRNPTDTSDPTSGEEMLSSPQTGATQLVGFYTVELDEPVRIRNGETFAVVITFSTADNSSVKIFVDETYENGTWISFTSHTEPGQTFTTSSGVWQDLHNDGRAARVKAYTVVVGMSFDQKSVELETGNTYTQMPTVRLSEDEVSGYTWVSSDPSVATVDSDGRVTAEKVGTAIITVSAATSSGSFSAAYQVVVKNSGSCGADLTYTLTGDGVLTITGSGAMNDYTDGGCPWDAYRAKITSVSLPSGMTSIGYGAFSSCTGLTAVTIPKSVTAVGENSFYGCEGLEEIIFEHDPADTMTIGQNAFRLTDALATRILVPNKRNLHTAVSGYDWTGGNRAVTYVSTEPAFSTITYDANGGTGAPEAASKEEGVDVFISDVIPTRTGYRFLGWADTEDAEEAQYQPGDRYTQDEDITLYAVWVPAGIAIQNAPEALTSGQYVLLKAQAYPDASVRITFRLKNSADSKYVTLSGTQLTARTVTQRVDVTVVAAARNDEVPPAEFTVAILPKATKVDIRRDADLLTGKTVLCDINEGVLSLNAVMTPADAAGDVSWKSSSPSVAEVDDNGMVTLHKTGRVTITAAADDGSRKSGKVTLDIVKAASSLGITNAPDVLQGGRRVALKTNIAMDDRTVDRHVTWSLDEACAAYASISSSGALSTKTVFEPVTIHVTAWATANQAAVDDAEIQLLPTAAAAQILYQDTLTEKTTVFPLRVGETLTLKGRCYPADAYGEGTWKSSSTKIATVDKDTGVVEGIKPGAATITYTFAGKSTSVKVQVGNPVTELAISAPSYELRSGKSMTLTAAFNADASIRKAAWSLEDAADSAYCSISSSGRLTAKTVYSDHEVKIKAASVDGTGMTAVSTVTIRPKTDTVMAIMDAASNDITGKTILLEPGEMMQVGAWTGLNQDGAAWKSRNTRAAVIDQNGNITAKAAGTTKITATTSDRRTASFTIRVAGRVKSIEVGVRNNLGPAVASGRTLTMTARTNTDASNKKVTWSLTYPNNDTKCASISSSGVLKAAAGLTAPTEVNVVATAADGSGTRSEAFNVEIYPAVTGVSVLFGGRVVNGLTVVTSEKETALTAKVFPNAAQQRATWKSSSTRIATVDENGVVTFLKSGTVTITATAADGSGKSVSFRLTYKP